MSIVSLTDIVLPKAPVDIPGSDNQIAVGALSFSDLVALMYRHKDTMAAAYLQFAEVQASGNTKGAVLSAVSSSAQDFTPLIATVIARAAGWPDNPVAEEKAAAFGMPTQLDALEKIAVLTFGRLEDGGVKKFVEAVTRAMAATGQLASILTASAAGSATSAKK